MSKELNKELNKELKTACSRLGLLIKAGKTPIDYEKKWEDFKKKSKR